ncbi:AraC family transcriptional regulator [Paenibacillus barcinonensis]|uniref:AraC family transcriptional regulator n=1 Tax=Paenibacillus barcinonensis TaxID=198119 RepID=UPI001C0FD330|nr:AraC family transcriptional regulator [Paenibacillus barcinonensis]MBU5354653.1 AraC family transcriptional regulator [Paenibacillus barcinonensis]
MNINTEGLRKPPPIPAYSLLGMEYFLITRDQRRIFDSQGQYGLIIVEKGRGKIADQLMLLEPGDTILMDSVSGVEIESGTEPLAGYFIIFHAVGSPDQKDMISNMSENLRPVRIKPNTSYLNEVKGMYALIEHCAVPLQQFKLQLQFQSILYEFCRVGMTVKPEENSLHAVRKSIAYLQEHYDEEHNVAQLASQLNLSRRHYTRLFKQLTGKAPIEFLNEYRINRSKELLLMKNEPSHHISSQIGMRDVTYFNRRFKQRVGCSPKEYVRKRHIDSRIVTLHYAGEILALGMKPIGSLDYTSEQLQPESPAIQSIGYNTCQLNKVKALRPDLIIASDFTDHAELAALGEIAPVIVIPWDMDAFDRLQRVALVLGKEQEAEAWRESYRSKKLAARAHCSQFISSTETAAIVRMEEGRVWIHASRFFPTFYDVIGFQPTSLMLQTTEVYPDMRRVSLQMHQLEQLEADRLYIVENDGVSFSRLFEQLQKANCWQALSAVRNRKVYRLRLQGISNSAYTLEWQLGRISCLMNPAPYDPSSDDYATVLL